METEGEKGKFEGLKGINKKANIYCLPRVRHVTSFTYKFHVILFGVYYSFNWRTWDCENFPSSNSWWVMGQWFKPTAKGLQILFLSTTYTGASKSDLCKGKQTEYEAAKVQLKWDSMNDNSMRTTLCPLLSGFKLPG